MSEVFHVEPFECPNCHHDILVDRFSLHAEINKPTIVKVVVIDAGSDRYELEKQIEEAATTLREWIYNTG